MISGVYEAPDVKGVDDESDKKDEYAIKHEYPQDEYDTTHEDMDGGTEKNEQQYEHKYDQEDHGYHELHEINNTATNIQLQKYDNYDGTQEYAIDIIEEPQETENTAHQFLGQSKKSVISMQVLHLLE